MNQILFNKKINNKHKYIYLIQLVVSIIISIIICIFIIIKYKKNESLEEVSKVLNKTVNLSSMYETNKLEVTNKYFGKLIIEKINLEYVIFNTFDENLLKIAPCRFYGPNNINQNGNICIAGHNYNDDRFFGRLDDLELGDKIMMMDFNGDTKEYIVYNIFETDEDDVSILKANKNYELTLLTCNNANKKRIIIKSFAKEY